jgi:hypothetical protein
MIVIKDGLFHLHHSGGAKRDGVDERCLSSQPAQATSSDAGATFFRFADRQELL